MTILKLYSLTTHKVFQVQLEEGMTVRDLSDAIFSLTDIPPERVRLYRFWRLLIGGEDAYTNTKTLISLGIDGKSLVQFAVAPDGDDSDGEDEQFIPFFYPDDVAKSIKECLQRTVTPPTGGHPATTQFLDRVQTYCQQGAAFEDAQLQRKAYSMIPVADIRAAAAARRETEPNLKTDQHALTAALLRWFKRQFFKWVDAPNCWQCGEEKTKLSHMDSPSEVERHFQATRTEVFLCTCGTKIRFPRYNDAGKLLETRRGRGHEWAKVFTVCARAMGLRARMVHDWTDHVWTEVWCGDADGQNGRWVHADSCEEALDEPLLYETGWGKKLTYCVATGSDCVLDVTRRYTNKFDEVCARRKEADEGLLAFGLYKLDARALSLLSAPEKKEALARMRCDISEMSGVRVARDVQGRPSGNRDWVEARGENELG